MATSQKNRRFGKVWDKTKSGLGKVWSGVKWSGRQLWSGAKWLGPKLWTGTVGALSGGCAGLVAPTMGLYDAVSGTKLNQKEQPSLGRRIAGGTVALICSPITLPLGVVYGTVGLLGGLALGASSDKITVNPMLIGKATYNMIRHPFLVFKLKKDAERGHKLPISMFTIQKRFIALLQKEAQEKAAQKQHLDTSPKEHEDNMSHMGSFSEYTGDVLHKESAVKNDNLRNRITTVFDTNSRKQSVDLEQPSSPPAYESRLPKSPSVSKPSPLATALDNEDMDDKEKPPKTTKK